MYLSHGDIKVTLIDNIITAVFTGAFNMEGINLYIHEARSAIATLHGQPFSMIIDNRAYEGCTPDGFEVLNEFNSWLSTTSLLAKAFIMASETNKQIIVNRTPSLSEQNINFFSDYPEAIKWLKEFY